MIRAVRDRRIADGIACRLVTQAVSPVCLHPSLETRPIPK